MTPLRLFKLNARGNSCSFCDTGRLNKAKNGLDYPYDIVYQLMGARGTTVRFCPDCLEGIAKEHSKLNSSKDET